MEGVKKISNEKKITTIFQPHRYSRVNLLKKEFASSFKFCDRVILCPVYAAGEKIDKNFNDKKLMFGEHHFSHAASAFYPSPFEEAVVLTLDGVGEWATTTVAIG